MKRQLSIVRQGPSLYMRDGPPEASDKRELVTHIERISVTRVLSGVLHQRMCGEDGRKYLVRSSDWLTKVVTRP